MNAATNPVVEPTMIPCNATLNAYLAEQADYVAERMVGQLYWIANYAVVESFDSQPSIDDVMKEAAAIALMPEEFIYNREIAAQEADSRKIDRSTAAAAEDRRPLSGKSHEAVLRHSEEFFALRATLQALKEAGFAHTKGQQELYDVARDRQNQWSARRKLADDLSARRQAEKRAEAVKGFDLGL